MFDPQMARSLEWTLATDGAEALDLHFEDVDRPELGPVTDQNKMLFVQVSLSLRLMFKVLFLYTVGILFHLECCIR